MRITQAERPSYKRIKGYSKFGNLRANPNLDMHIPKRYKKKYEHKKIKSGMISDIRIENESHLQSGSIIQLENVRKSLALKKHIQKTFDSESEERRPIRVSKSRKRVKSKEGANLIGIHLKVQKPQEPEMDVEIKLEESYSSREEEKIKSAGRKGGEIEISFTEHKNGSSSPERHTVFQINAENEIEMAKMTENEIKSTKITVHSKRSNMGLMIFDDAEEDIEGKSRHDSEEEIREEKEVESALVMVMDSIEDTEQEESVRKVNKVNNGDYGNALKIHMERSKNLQPDKSIDSNAE